MYFSVLIPVYNVEKYIRQSIESVLSQKETDYEIVLVDDGSTDNSGMICNEYAEKYPDFIRVIHKQNEGLLLTRRRAIREARGDWFVHLDSDDYMFPGALSSIRKMGESTGADLIIAKIVYGQQNNADMSVITQLPFYDGEVFESENQKYRLRMQLLYGGQMTAIYQKIAKREIVDVNTDYGCFNNVSMMEDHLQSLALLDQTKKTVYMDMPIIYYRYNDDSITKKKGYHSYFHAFNSISLVYSQETKYRKKWGVTEVDDSWVRAKHLRKLCPILIDTIQNATKVELRELIDCLNQKNDLKDDLKKADIKVLGRKSRIVFCLAFSGRICLLKLLFK